MSREDAHFRLRLPHDVKAWLAAESKREIRSITAQIVFLLRKEMAAGEDFGRNAPAAGNDNAAWPGGASITQMKEASE